MKLRLVHPCPLPHALAGLVLALLLQFAGPAQLTHAAVPADCPESLAEDDGVPAFLKDRATQAAKFADLESITAYPAEMHAKFDANIKIITNGEDALAAQLLLMRNARESIDIGHFILITDRAGKLILAETKAALLRGVNVRILVDSLGSGPSIRGIVSDLKSVLAANLDSPGRKGKVEVAVFNPQMNLSGTVRKWFTKLTNLFRSTQDKLPTPHLTLQNRLHDKIVAADLHLPQDAVVIMGGRGIEEAYYPIFGYEAGTFQDLEFVVRNARRPSGPFHLGEVLGAYYNSLYYHLGNKVLGLGFRNFLGSLARKRLREIEKIAAVDADPRAPIGSRIAKLDQERFLEEGFEPASLQFVHEAQNAMRRGLFRDYASKDAFTSANPGSITMSLRERLLTSDDTIDIVSAYAWFPPEEIQMLRDWVAAKPTRRVRIITSSIATDGTIVGTALADLELGPAFASNPRITVLTYGKLDDARYGGPTWYGRLHSKYYLFDKKRAALVSYNGDPRSRYWSTESGFQVDESPATVAFLVQDADRLAAGSTEWGSPEWKAVQEHPKNRMKTRLKNIVGALIWALRLSPLA